MTLVGAFAGGAIASRIGVMRTLFLGGLLSAATNLLFSALAFGVGGGICLLGEVLRGWYLTMGLDKELAGTLTSCTLVALSALLTTLGLYQKLAAKAGAGTLVPITGFANAVVSAAIEFKTEGRVLGTGAKMFIIAGPVIVYGTLAAVLYGSVYWLLQ